MKHETKKIEDRYFFYGDISKEKLVNAGEDLLKAIKGHRVVCADITLVHSSNLGENFHIVLKKRYKKGQFQYFLNVLKHCWYEYGYIEGMIWCNNGVWFERAERYGYGIGWRKMCCPEIPPELC